MKKGKVIKKIITKYGIKHGDLIDINLIKFISAKECIEINNLMTILGISVNGRSHIRKNTFNKARVNIFNSEELKEIEILVKDEIKGIHKITEKRLNRLCNKYKINSSILNKILKISKNQTYKLKKGQKHIILKHDNEEKKIMNELFIEEVKYKNFVNKELIEYLKQKYKLEDEEICILLKVKNLNYKNLMQMKTKKMKIDLMDEYEKREIEQKLIEKYKMQDYITKDEIIKIKEEIKATDTIIKDTFCISKEAYYRVINNETRKTRISLKETKLKVNFLKMDIKYEYGEGFYSSAELRKLCRKYKIEFDNFLKNLSTNINRYPYMKQALKENPKGIYIGEEHRISAEFANKYAQRIENLCKRITNKYCYLSYLDTEKTDISQEAITLILEKGGNIEKNFSYDEDLMFNLFASKVKYFVIGKRNKRYKEILLDGFEEYIGKTDEYSFLDEELDDSVYCVDSRIKRIHQKVMKIFQDNNDYIYHNRKNAYKIISYKLKISIEKLEKVIQEIGKIYLQYGFARECSNGTIIDMSDSDNF